MTRAPRRSLPSQSSAAAGGTGGADARGAEAREPDAAGRTARDLFLLVLIAAPIVLVGTLSYFTGHFGPLIDGVDYAQIARNFLEGRPFVSDVALPVSIAFPFGRSLPQPLIYRPPVFPVALAPFLALIGPTDHAVIAAGVAFALLAGVATYVFGRAVGGRALGLCSAAVVMLHTGLWSEAGHGNAEPLAVALVALLLALLVTRRAGWAGFVLGVLVLTKAHLLALIPALFIPAWLRGSGRWRDLVRFGAGALVAVAPWAARNLVVTGRPFFDLHTYTEAQQARSRAPVFEFHRRTEVVSAQTIVRSDPTRVLDRAGGKLLMNARRMPAYIGWGAITLFGLAVCAPAPAGPRRDVRRVALAAVGSLGLLLAPTAMIPRYFLPLLPIVAVGGLDAIARLIARLPALTRAVPAAAAALLIAWPAGARLAGATGRLSRGELGEFRAPTTETLRAQTAATDIVVSDDLSIAWYAHRRVVWLPWDAASLRALDAAIPIDAVYLRQTADRIRYYLGDETRDAIVAFVRDECEPGVAEPDGSGLLFRRRRAEAAR